MNAASSRREPYYRWLIPAGILLLFLSIAREYPEWKAQRQKNTEKDRDKNCTKQEDAPPTTETTTQGADTSSSSPWPTNFSIRWIPYIPFAVVYLVFKALWTGLRLLVLHSILFAEHACVHLMVAVEKAAQWSVQEGPEFVRTKVVAPVCSTAVAIWKSPAMAKVKASIEETVIPGIVRISISIHASLKAVFVKLVAWIHIVADPVKSAAVWFAVECLYNPAHAIGSRLATLSHTFLQTAKIYFGELVKDAIDLGKVVGRVGAWIWIRMLTPLWTKLCALGNAITTGLRQFLPWLGRILYTRVIAPVGRAVLDGFRILRSHPTLLAGLQALSSKVQEKCSLALQRLESVNWLILLETVLTKAFTTGHYYTVLTLTVVGDGLKYFAVEMVPNAYQDLMNALELARPVVAWVIEKFLQVAHPLWQVVSWVSWAVYTRTGPVLAWLHKNIAMPAYALWVSSILPVLSALANAVIVNTTRISNMILKAVPALAAVVIPIWNALAQVALALQAVMAQAGAKVVELSGGLGVYIQSLGPQFEAFKVQTGRVMDELVLTTSNFMMDWVKKEKRD
ncbi:hypothetical protein BG015_010522 [Linnemannia schmuckeri]|uniref:Uncharacterized protein n=1 Tax=Linnemannia schmuckeri TaxID=64567 RepID=A0A9P5RW11_9FUNG|nr:hypothetical protein BG015_010522 [Linnemannia schmuckeri]